jgi:hypothetical protein
MRNPISYAAVFSEEAPLAIWPIIADVLKRSDDGLEAARPKGYSDRFLASWRNLIALCVAARSIGSFDYSISQLLQLDCNEITRRFIQEIWTVTQNLEGSAERSRGIARSARPFRSHAFVARCCQAVAAAFKIDGDNVVGRRPLPLGNFGKPIPPEYLIDRVDAELPMQPWKPGEHTRLAKQLNVKPGLVHAAIEILIARGRRLKQLDGVVFNTDGSIAASDTSRSSTQES